MNEVYLRLNSCSGLAAFALVPSSFLAFSPPVGWEGSNTGIQELHNDFYLCERVQLGPFERGPIGIVLEFTGINGGPPSCQEGDWYSQEALLAIWTTDPQVTAYFARQGLTARTLELSRGWDAAGELRSAHWTIKGHGFEGYLDARNTTASSTLSTEGLIRMFWENDVGGISFLSLNTHLASDANGVPSVTGHLPPPFSYSNLGVATYVGYGAGLDDSSLDGPIYRFGDHQCREPLPPV